MEYKKRIRIRVGEKPRHNLRNVVLVFALLLFGFGISDFANSQSLKIKAPRQCLEKMSIVAKEQFDSVRFTASTDDILQQVNKLCEDKERQNMLSRSFYLVIPGAILLIIGIFIK
ncbi:MAG: hypothetical protein Q8N14_07130 [Candidatus Omnitrophota bacterium]|nr:hypothetical protein [Candidatus Omnitrophota bacterium]